VSAQNELSLLKTGGRHRLLPACVEHGLGMLPYFPLASGMLTGKYRRGEPVPEGTRLALWPESRTAPLLAGDKQPGGRRPSGDRRHPTTGDPQLRTRDKSRVNGRALGSDE
jgi:aryl-alcohol dehydrogenase-like predicted oxidoreductase